MILGKANYNKQNPHEILVSVAKIKVYLNGDEYLGTCIGT